MSRPIVLISLKEYKDSCAAKCHYNGFVYDPDGYLLNVENKKQTIVCDKPECPDLYYTKDTRFVRHEYVTKITVLDLEGYDFVFGMSGDFIEVKPESDPNRKGQIYIRQIKQKRSVTKIESEIFEDVRIQDMKNMLSSISYTKIFTYIIALLMKNELGLLRKEKISVEVMKKDGTASLSNLPPEYAIHDSTTIAQSIKNFPFVLGVLREGKKDELELYSTIWNVLNLLGAHELLGHKYVGWWSDDYSTHYLTYLYQMIHPSWKNTTKPFKEHTEKGLNRYINKNRSDFIIENDKFVEKENILLLQKLGFYSKDKLSGKDSISFNEQIKDKIFDIHKMKNENPFKN